MPGGPRAGSTGGASTAPASTRCDGGRYRGRRATDAVAVGLHYYTSFVISGAPCGWNSLHVGGPAATPIRASAPVTGWRRPEVASPHGPATHPSEPVRRRPGSGCIVAQSAGRAGRVLDRGIDSRPTTTGASNGPRHGATAPRTSRRSDSLYILYYIPSYRIFLRSSARWSAGVAIRLANQSSRSLRDRPSSRAERRRSCYRSGGIRHATRRSIPSSRPVTWPERGGRTAVRAPERAVDFT